MQADFDKRLAATAEAFDAYAQCVGVERAADWLNNVAGVRDVKRIGNYARGSNFNNAFRQLDLVRNLLDDKLTAIAKRQQREAMASRRKRLAQDGARREHRAEQTKSLNDHLVEYVIVATQADVRADTEFEASLAKAEESGRSEREAACKHEDQARRRERNDRAERRRNALNFALAPFEEERRRLDEWREAELKASARLYPREQMKASVESDMKKYLAITERALAAHEERDDRIEATYQGKCADIEARRAAKRREVDALFPH